MSSQVESIQKRDPDMEAVWSALETAGQADVAKKMMEHEGETIRNVWNILMTNGGEIPTAERQTRTDELVAASMKAALEGKKLRYIGPPAPQKSVHSSETPGPDNGYTQRMLATRREMEQVEGHKIKNL